MHIWELYLRAQTNTHTKYINAALIIIGQWIINFKYILIWNMDAMREEKKKREQKMKMNRYYNFIFFTFFKMGICKYANLNGAFT